LERLEGGGIYAVFQTLMAFFQGPALALILTGLLWPRANGKGAMAGFLGGVSCAVGLFTLSSKGVCEALGWKPLFQISDPYLYFSVWSFVTAILLTVVVSLLTPPEPAEKIRGLVFRRRGAVLREGGAA
jgi:Na+/proline symporter